MDRKTASLAVGAAASVALLALLALPYALFDASVVQVYYGVGPVTPLLLTLFAGVTLVALPSAAAGRTDAETVAGLTLVVGVGSVLIAVPWALAAATAAGGIDTTPLFWYHRWAVVGAGAVLAVAGIAASPLADPKGP